MKQANSKEGILSLRGFPSGSLAIPNGVSFVADIFNPNISLRIIPPKPSFNIKFPFIA